MSKIGSVGDILVDEYSPVKVTLNLDPPKDVPCVVLHDRHISAIYHSLQRMAHPLYSSGGVPPGYQPVPMYVMEGSKSSRRIAFGFVSAICPQRVRVSR